uniref:E3 ubiquitin-protein ligase synoviolin B-like n=1 Tax=Styela clava TaxID=7725 RepID=UPI001939C6FD|nr:E3 ubiquitin-protein ligase synoviolin B-like [Styela clava]
MKMRGALLTAGSFALTGAVVANAWIQKKQFFPTVVYLTKSSPCMAVLYIQAFVFVLLLGKLMRKVFFGQLRPAETEHLIERSWYAVTDTCLAFTMFRDDFSPRFVASFTFLLFLKCFHWLAEDRVDYMERSPIITLLFKFRVLSLLSLLSILDAYFVNSSYETTLSKGASVQLVFGFEYAILLTVLLTITLKYILHSIDLQSENPWENKAVYMLYVELVTGFLRVILYTCFTAIMIKIHTFPLFAIRPMYLTMRQFKKAVSDIVLSRRAIRNMNTLYPDATAEDLAEGDSTCIICREEMQPPQPGAQPGNRRNTAGINKKLPCSHIFHAACLRSWFQRQQTCPTCRLDVLVSVPTTTPAPPQAAPPPQPGHPNVPPGMVPPVPGQNPFMFPPMFPPPGMFHHPPHQQQPVPPPAAGNAQQAPGSSSSTQPSTSSSVPPHPATNIPSPFMFMPPLPTMMMPPPPMPPGNYSGMSDDQLRAMEGMERRAVENRLECLRNINSLLDAAMLQITQYVTVVRGQGQQGFQIPPFDPSQLPKQTTPEAVPPEEVVTSSQSFSANITSTTQPQAQPTEESDNIPGTSGISEIISEQTDIKEPLQVAHTATVSGENEVVEPEDANELRRRRLAKLDSAKNLQEMNNDTPGTSS